MNDYRCPKHDELLSNVLRGGAGWCARCQFYVQSRNHPMPKLSPEVQAKRDAALMIKSKKKKPSRQRKASKIFAQPTKTTRSKRKPVRKVKELKGNERK